MTETHPVGTAPQRPKNKVRREMRPERIEIEGDTLVRNDVLAKEYKRSERGVNREDANGAPYCYIAGVKYRPINAYLRFLASKIKVKGQPPKRPRRTRR